MVIVGILALQGAYEKHKIILDRLSVKSKYIRYEKDLHDCDGLIIPGGESTTLSKMIEKNKLYKCLLSFIKNKAVLGTCAGLIMLSKIKNKHIKSFNIFDIEINRNGWGTQINSFIKKIKLNGIDNNFINAIFIRAPRIKKINNKKISIMASIDNEPVLIKYKNCLGATFHPELTNNYLIHKFFIRMINDK